MTKTIAVLLALLALIAAPDRARAENSPEYISVNLVKNLVEVALIQSERARPEVPDDFAARMLDIDQASIRDLYAEADRSGQGASIRRQAQQRAASILAASRPGGFLTTFPDPLRVRADLARVGQAEGASPLVIAARQAGRFLMLADVVENTADTPGYPLPPSLARLRALYVVHFLDIRDRIDPTLEPMGQGCGPLSGMLGGCKRRTFYNTRVDYEYDRGPATEAAELYIPEALRDRFIDMSGGGRSRIRDQRDMAAARDRQASSSSTFSAPGGPRIFVTGMVLFIVGGIGFLIWRQFFKEAEPEPVPIAPPPTKNHGAADFQYLDARGNPKDTVQGVFLGKQSRPGRTTEISYPLYTKPEMHTLIMAPTRTGKGTRIIIPTLARYENSVVVIDPKGENAAVTGRIRKQIGQQVHVLNPWGVLDAELKGRGLSPEAFNPLDAIKAYDPNAVGIARSMAQTIIPNAPDAKDPFWQQSATAILTAVFLYLADWPGEKKTLARAKEIISLPLAQLEKEYFYRMAGSDAYDGAIRQTITPFIGTKELPSIMSTLNTATTFIIDPRLRAATARSDFDVNKLPIERSTIYLVIPPAQMQAQAVWLRLILAAVTNAYRYAKKRTVRCMMIIDEMPALGRLPDLPSDLATMSGYGLDYTLIIQDMGQLKQQYGDMAQSILGNCGWKWMSNTSDFESAKYVSDALGDRTIVTVNQSESASTNVNAKGGEGGGNSKSTSFGEMGRKLMTPQEVMKEGRTLAIVFGPNGDPWHVSPIDYWNLTKEFDWLKASMMKGYFEPPLTFDSNPYVEK